MPKCKQSSKKILNLHPFVEFLYIGTLSSILAMCCWSSSICFDTHRSSLLTFMNDACEILCTSLVNMDNTTQKFGRWNVAIMVVGLSWDLILTICNLLFTAYIPFIYLTHFIYYLLCINWLCSTWSTRE